MLVDSDGYKYTPEVIRALKEGFEGCKPSFLIQLFWIFIPTWKYIRWRRYKEIR